MDYVALAESQGGDHGLAEYSKEGSRLRLEKVEIPGTGVAVYCDTATPTPRPFLTRPFRRAAFDLVHNLAHPGIKSTSRLVVRVAINEGGLPQLSSSVRVVPAIEGVSARFGAGRRILCSVQQFRARPPRHYRNAGLGGQAILSNVRGPFHTMARGISPARSGSGDGREGVLRGLDLPIRGTVESHDGSRAPV